VEEAVRLAPGLALGHHRLGEAWELLGAYDRAEEAWRRAVALDPRLGPAHYRLGRVLMTRAYLASLDLWHGRKIAPEGERMAVEAAREIEAAQAEGSGFDHDLQRQAAAAMLAWLRGDRDTARRVCRAALDHFGNRPGSEDFHWILGLAAEPPEDPLPAYDAAIALRPRFPLALYVRADARLQRRDYDGAVADYDEAIRLVPDFHEARIYRATVLYQKRDAPAALAAFTDIIERGLLLPAAYNGRGWTRIELMEDLDGGIADLGEAIRRKPDGYGLPYAERARAHFRKGRFAEAAADCTKAIPLMPDWTDLRRLRARCRAALGDREGAREDLKALGEAPGGELWKEIEGTRKPDRP
jgi:tetratricopeptide (TPR) repeat protein